MLLSAFASMVRRATVRHVKGDVGVTASTAVFGQLGRLG
jgi:hypothetical protein